MATGWLDFHGTYQRSGAPYNVALAGSPNNTGKYNVNLGQAHGAGYGYGIKFSNSGYRITGQLNLIAYAIQDNLNWVPSSPTYSPYGGNYNYTLTIQTSNNNQGGWQTTVFKKVIFSHNGSWSNPDAMYANGNWRLTAQKSQWTGTFTIPTNTTHVKFTLTADNPMDVEPVVFPIKIIIPDFRPWAVRKSGTFRSLDRASGRFRVRKSGRWVDSPKYAGGNVANTGSSRIRKSGVWRSQSRVGS